MTEHKHARVLWGRAWSNCKISLAASNLGASRVFFNCRSSLQVSGLRVVKVDYNRPSEAE